jgi:glucokinase
MIRPPVVLGLDFGGTKVAAAVCDEAGNKLASVVVPSRGELGARASFDHAIEAARDLLRGAVPGSPLSAVGAATFGIPFEDRVELAPAIRGWSSLPFGASLRAAFPGAAIRIATDAKAAARAEARWGALAGHDPALYLNLGTGLAAAVVANGQVLAGRHGAAGEIGYGLREIADIGPQASGRLILEDVVSGQGLQRQAQAAGRTLTAAEVFAASATDPELDELVSGFVRELAFHVVNLAILVDPSRIAVGGGMVKSWDRIQPTLSRALKQAVPYPPDLVLAHFPHDAPLLGAVALAVDAAGPKRASGLARPTFAASLNGQDDAHDQQIPGNGAPDRTGADGASAATTSETTAVTTSETAPLA